jgi:tetratricopeptide (TPR) repeat protein
VKILGNRTLPHPILVGRERELAKLDDILNSAFEGKGNTVLISGEAGSGKTRIAEEFLKIAKEKDSTILTSKCLSQANEPYFAFAEAFENYSSAFEGQNDATANNLNIKSLLLNRSDWSRNESGESSTPQSWRDQTFAAVSKELGFLSIRKPIILFIDDIHWADSASLSLFHYLSRNVTSERMIILASFRIEELTPLWEGQPHPLFEILQLMRRESTFEEIRLANLTQQQTIEIAQSMLGGQLTKEFAEKLSAESLGNPLFVVEYLRMLNEQGNLTTVNNQWSFKTDLVDIPLIVKEIILRRIGFLKSEQRRVLDAASVIGDNFDVDLLGGVLCQDRISILETLNEISRSNSLVRSEEDYFRFDHPKSREVLYEEIRPPLKKGYHTLVAEQIEIQSKKDSNPRLSDLAHHYTLAGRKKESIKYSLAAGKDALIRSSNIEAIKHFKFVLNTASNGKEFDNEIIEAKEGLGDSYFANSMYREALETYELLVATQEGSIRARAFRKAMDSAFFQGNFEHLIELTTKAQEYVKLDRLEGARVRMNIGRALSNLGKAHEGLLQMEQALKTFEEEFSLPDTARVLMGIAIIALMLNQREKALAAAARSIKLYEELGDFRGQMDASNRAGQAYYFCYLETESLREFEKAIQIGERIHDYNRLAEATTYSSWIFTRNGDLENALALSLKAAEHAKKTDSFWTLGLVYSNLALQFAKIGNLKNAEDYYSKLLTLPPPILRNPVVKFPLLKAIMLTAKGQYKEANASFEEMLKQPSLLPGSLEARASYAWALTKQGRLAEASDQIEEDNKNRKSLLLRLENSALQFGFMAPIQGSSNVEVKVRLDIINVSNNSISLVKVEHLAPPALAFASVPEGWAHREDLYATDQKELGSQEVETLKIRLQPSNSGIFHLTPKITYKDKLGNIQSYQPAPLTITINPTQQFPSKSSSAIVSSLKLDLKCESSQKALDFLVVAFINDYKTQKLPLERSGWRTLMDILRQGSVSQYSLYGVAGKRGKVLSELEGKGLVESRFFEGERGRGGKVVKVRIAIESETVKQRIKDKIQL